MQTGNLVKSYLEQMPALRPLVIVFKRFLSQRGMSDASKSGLGSYAATLMCINFLQTNPCQRPREVLDDPFKTGSLGTLLSDFFYYYSLQYPHEDDVYMSISEGKVLASDSESRQLGLDIRCPLNGGNVAKSLGPRFFKDMIRSFNLSYTAILRNGPTDRNILGPISSVNQKMIEQRASIHNLVHSGKLGALGNVISQTTTWRRNYGSQPGGGGSASFVMPALLPFSSTSESIERGERQRQASSLSSSGRKNIPELSEPKRHADNGDGMIGAKPPRKKRRRRNKHSD